MVPHSAQARVGVLELGQLDLELGLVGGRAAGEDVQDQLRAVHDLPQRFLLKVADLARGKVVVEDDRRGLKLLAQGLELGDLPLAHVGGAYGLLEPLGDLADDLGPGLFGQGAQLAEGVVGGVGVQWAGPPVSLEGLGEPNRREDRAFSGDFDCGAFFGQARIVGGGAATSGPLRT